MPVVSMSGLALFGSLICMAMQSASLDPNVIFEQATNRMTSAILHIRKTGRLADVREDLLRAAAEFAAVHQVLAPSSHPNSTLSLIHSAQCLRIVQQWAESKKLYERAIELARTNNEIEFQAKAWLGIEKVESIGYKNHAASLNAIDEALRLVRSAGNLKSLEANLILERADRETQAGNLEDALKFVNSSIETAGKLDDKDLLQPALYSRSSIKHNMAAALLQQYVNLPHKTPADWKRCQATEQHIRDLLADSQKDLMQSAQLAADLGFDFISAATSSELGLYKALSASVENTIAIKHEAYKTQGEAPAPELSRSVLTTGGAKHLEVNMIGLALPPMNEQDTKAFLQGIQSLSGAGGSSTINWRQYFMEGQLRESQHHLDQALVFYREAARISNEERRTLPSDVSRALFATERASLYDRLFLNLLDQRNYSEAFYWIEQSRARATADLLASADIRLPSESERRLYADLASARARKAAALKNSSAIAEIDTLIEDLVAQIRKQSPDLLELVDSQPASFGELRQAAKNAPFDLLYYVLHQGRLIIWHIGPAQTQAKAFFAPASELERLAAKLKTSLEKDTVAFDTGAAKDLYFFLLAPAINWIETNHLVIIPAPELTGIPFQVLLDEAGEQFLGEKFAISYAPSASVAVKLHPSADLKDATALVVLGPDLKHAQSDAEAIANSFARHSVIPVAQATRSKLLKEVPGKNLVHFAAHGTFEPNSPMLSYIKLTPEKGHNGNLTAAEMFELSLKNASLVTLAVCEAAKTGSLGTNELFGMSRSLLYAGAHNLLLPLWRVNDEATSLWMNAFYSHARSHPLPESVMMANRALRRHPIYSSHPNYWAPFVLIGR